jgi:secreted trypsin-like serine protease
MLAMGLAVNSASALDGNDAADQPEDGESLRIIGGTPAESGRWTSLVALILDRGGGRRSQCGGTVIERSWVLTAAHCVVTAGGMTPPQGVTVIEGTVNLASGGRRLGVSQIIVHPGYRPGASGQPFDIALLRLAEPSRVEPQALLGRGAAPNVLQPKEMATVVGFGGIQPMLAPGSAQQIRPTGPQTPSERLLQVNVPLVSLDRCRQSYGPRIEPSQICAGFEQGGKDSCQGDSGGPLFMLGPVSRPVQVGVVSWGSGCAQPGKYGVYSSVPAFEDFIRSNVPGTRFVGSAASVAARPSGSSPQARPYQPRPSSYAGKRRPRPKPNGWASRPRTPADALLDVGEAAPATPPGLVGQVSLDILPGEQIPVGDTITLRIRSGVAGTLMVFAIDSEGRTTQLFPNRRSSPTPSAFRTATQVTPGSTIALPGPTDGFVLRAKPPVGDNTIIAVVAPPGIKADEILSRNMDLAEIPEVESFFEELADLLEDARDRMPLLTTAPESEITRDLSTQPVRAPIPMAERHFTIVDK